MKILIFISILTLTGCAQLKPTTVKDAKAIETKVEKVAVEVRDAKTKAKTRQEKIEKIITTVIQTSDNDKKTLFYILLVNIAATLGNSYYLYKKGKDSPILKDVSVVTSGKLGYIKRCIVKIIKKYYDKFLAKRK